MTARTKTALLILTLLACLVPQAASAGGVAEPAGEPVVATQEYGASLYEHHCLQCHQETAFIREDSKVHNRADLDGFVLRWSEHLKLQWDEAARQAVGDYLNRRYYQFEPVQRLH